MNASLRRRLFVWLSASIAVAGAVAAVLSFGLAYQDANALQDMQLQQIAAVLANNAIPAAPRFRPRNNEEAETHLVVKLLGSGRSDPDPEIDLALADALPDGLQSIEPSGVRWRVVVSRTASNQRFGVAQRMTVRDEEAVRGALLTLVPLLVMVPVLMLIVRLLLRQAFAPIVEMSAEVDRLDGSRLVAVDERRIALEVLPLVQAINRMTLRLARALEQQRRLVSDAAHELRTPVAALIVQADNVQSVPLSSEARARMGALRGGLTRISALIEQLLSLARVQGARASGTSEVALSDLVRAVIEATLPLAQAKGIDLGCVRADPAVVRGDRSHAYALVRNAIDNAVRYTPAGGAVDVSVAIDAQSACVVVEDTGPGIDDTDLERVFEPFFRVLGSNEAGSGLGLSIAQSAAQALGGAIRLSRRSDGRSGLRFVYRQPALDGRDG